MTSLAKLHEEIRRCRVCLDSPSGPSLPHTPNPVCVPSSTAKIAVCGQAPGIRVHRSGRPFTDPSGMRLRAWMGVDEAQFYDATKVAIIPMGFCFPGYDKSGGDLPPRRECRTTWHDQLFAAMPQLELKLVIGSSAIDYHLGNSKRKTVTETVSCWREYLSISPKVLVLPHPSWRNNAWLKRNPWFEHEVLPTLRETVRTLI